MRKSVLLRDMPGFPQFARQLTDSVAELSLALADEHDAQVNAVLEQMRSRLAKKLTSQIGGLAATKLADAFVAAVAGHRREIESAGATPPAVLN